MSSRRWSDVEPDMFPENIAKQIRRATSDDREVTDADPGEQMAQPTTRSPRKPMNRREQELQITCFEWADMAIFPAHLSERARWLLPPTKIGEFMHHTPNGGGRSKAEGGIFKAMGVRAGYPDVSLDLALVDLSDPSRLVFYPGWRCELKIDNEQLRPSQIIASNMLRRAGYIFDEARSLEEFIAKCNDYLALGVPIHRSLWDERQTLG